MEDNFYFAFFDIHTPGENESESEKDLEKEKRKKIKEILQNSGGKSISESSYLLRTNKDIESIYDEVVSQVFSDTQKRNSDNFSIGQISDSYLSFPEYEDKKNRLQIASIQWSKLAGISQ